MRQYSDYHLLLMRVPTPSFLDGSSDITETQKGSPDFSSYPPAGAIQEDPSPRSPVSSPLESKAADAAPPEASAAAPLCAHLFCERPATNGDLCERHADEMADIRADYYELQREYEAGW